MNHMQKPEKNRTESYNPPRSCLVDIVTVEVPCSQYSEPPIKWSYDIEEYVKVITLVVPYKAANSDEDLENWLDHII